MVFSWVGARKASLTTLRRTGYGKIDTPARIFWRVGLSN